MEYRFEILERRVCHQGFFRLERHRIRHQLYEGGWGEVVREVFERGHAAAVLPYDPVRDNLVVIEQFRVGATSDPRGAWLLEFVAGIIEPGENPAQVVRREAVEEAGCHIAELEPIAEFILSPGGCSERIHLFCGRVDSRGLGGVHGVREEGEDIRVSVVDHAQAMAWLAAGKVTSATTIIALQWLALHRQELRSRWLGVPGRATQALNPRRS